MRLTLACLIATATLSAQSSGLKLFLDCQQMYCDMDFFRRELPWVDWVRDPKAADVHVLLVSRGTGSGGDRTTLRFLGREAFAGLEDELTYDAPPTATPDEVRKELASRLALGLARYAVRLPLGSRLALKAEEAKTETAQGKEKDPWNAWVYRLGVNSNVSGESRTSSSYVGLNASASRVTEDLILRLSSSGSWNRSRYDLADEVFRSNRESYYGSGTAAWSLGPQWTAGFMGSATKAASENLRGQARLAGGVEYSVWPYSQSSQRQLSFLYEVGGARAHYLEETIFGKRAETLWDNALTASLDMNQPWGTASFSLSSSAYLHDWSKNSVSLFGNLQVRLAKGLSLNLFSSYSKVRNQLGLPRGGASDDEVLLRLKELATDYRYSAYIGISYTFGSVFNNVVNTRFRGSGGSRSYYF